MATNQHKRMAEQARGRNFSVPIPGKRSCELVFEEAELPAAGAYITTMVTDVWKSREVNLHIEWTSGDTGSHITIIPEASNEETPSEDSWYPVGVTDSSVTLEDLSVDPSSTYDPENFAVMQFSPLAIRPPAAKAANDVMRLVVSVGTGQSKYMRFNVAETGTVGTPSTVELKTSKVT